MAKLSRRPQDEPRTPPAAEIAVMLRQSTVPERRADSTHRMTTSFLLAFETGTLSSLAALIGPDVSDGRAEGPQLTSALM